jgi:predicted nucleic acid-binding protein
MYVLDTSALASHFLRQPGADDVEALLAADREAIGVCVLSWFELRYVLIRCGLTAADAARAVELYRGLRVKSCPVTDDVVDRAMALRDATKSRLPLADALIAGCAAVHGARLVHRDADLDGVPGPSLKTLRIPSRTGPPVVRERVATYRTRKRA